jgi:hypothetical protein
MREEDRNDELLGMTDLQFLEYKRVSEELVEAKQELAELRGHHGGDCHMNDMQIKLLLSSISDILTTSKDLTEAAERFKRITAAAGMPGPSLEAES